jgi:alpha/beta hydrolase family protein
VATAALVLLLAATPLFAQGATPIPSVTGPITGPGPMYAGLMEFPKGTGLAESGYDAKEYFVSGTANGMPYTTRIVVRAPSDPRKFSGIVTAEAMHPSGYSWMFAFNRAYVMGEGHASVEIVSGLGPVPLANPERYKTLNVQQGQANEIIAQVGALIKSNPANGPLGARRVRTMILMGTSASSRILTQYLPAHRTFRMADGKPIFDGFLATSIGGDETIAKVDVPLIQMPTMTEVDGAAATGNKYRRPDGDQPGDQFRIYEVAGMSHNDSRENLTYTPDPCRYPVSQFPEGAGMSVGLHHLLQWVDKGKVAPRAPYIEVDGNKANDGSLMALDAHGNVKGGLRTTYVDVPLKKYNVPNEENPQPIPNPSSHVRARQGGAAFYCRIAGYEMPLSAGELKALYKSKADYQQKVERRLNQLIAEGWFVPAYRSLVLGDAAKFPVED